MMPGEHMVDFEELVLRCKDDRAKDYIAEAVACYKSGAFRSCIVATWVAVVYDFIGKLRELDLSGDKKARSKLKEFDQLRAHYGDDGSLGQDIEGLLRFEREVLIMARDDFELISLIEYDDLDRLYKDRNRCAHPSLIAIDQVYQPTAELARVHVGNAVTHLLQHQPVQGQAALTRLEEEIGSMYFPADVEGAMKHFRTGPLLRPRDALVRNLVIVLLKNLLLQQDGALRVEQCVAAIGAVRRMHREVAERTIADQLSRIVRRLLDEELHRAIEFLGMVPDTWQYLGDDMQSKLLRYIEAMADEKAQHSIYFALDVPQLRELAIAALANMSTESLSALVGEHQRSEYLNRAIDLYSVASSWNVANTVGSNLIIPLASYLDAEQVETIKQIVLNNSEVRFSRQLLSVLTAIFRSGKMSEQEYDELRDHL